MVYLYIFNIAIILRDFIIIYVYTILHDNGLTKKGTKKSNVSERWSDLNGMVKKGGRRFKDLSLSFLSCRPYLKYKLGAFFANLNRKRSLFTRRDKRLPSSKPSFYYYYYRWCCCLLLANLATMQQQGVSQGQLNQAILHLKHAGGTTYKAVATVLQPIRIEKW